MPSLRPAAALQQAFTESLTSGSFIDTKFYVFSRRNSSEGRVDKPRAVYANKSILKERCPGYFAPMLYNSGFSESVPRDIEGGFPEDETPYVEDYSYFSDSDLDEEEDDLTLSIGSLAETAAPNSSIDAEETTDPVRLGQVIVIKDAAFLTFSAILSYLHTDEIEFDPFGTSDCALQSRRDRQRRPSPKSIYRLADKYGIEELKSLALENIRLNLSSYDISREIFSEFTSWYPEVLALEVCAMVKALRDQYTVHIEKLMANIEKFGHADIPYSSNALIMLANALADLEFDCDKLDKGEVAALPANSLSSGSRWTDLKKAVTKALHSGRFIDTKVYSRLGRNAQQTLPLYYSSAAVNVCPESLSNRLLNFFPTVESDDDDDSDLEEDDKPEGQSGSIETEALRETPSMTTASNRLSDNSLKHTWEVSSTLYSNGAFATWKAFLYYMYTGNLSFAPLRSQGAQARLGDSYHSRIDSSVPLCSPKSICRLAELFGLEELQKLAQEDIISKIGQDNAFEEAFSKFSSSHPTILNAAIQVLTPYSRNTLTLARLSDKIRVTAGHDTHHSGALKSFFEMLISKAIIGVELKCMSCNFVGSQTDFIRYNECPKCPEKSVRCGNCNYTANYARVFSSSKICPSCDFRLKC